MSVPLVIQLDQEQFFWVIARVAGLTSFGALSISLLAGMAIRTGVLDWLANNRALRGLHEFMAAIWIPLGGLHMAALALDHTARIRPVDLLVPFQVSYAPVPIGLGTVSALLIALVAATGWLRRRMPARLWQWIHRLSYVAFATMFLHALLSGSDFSDPAVSALTYAVAAFLAVLVAARVFRGRLPAA